MKLQYPTAEPEEEVLEPGQESQHRMSLWSQQLQQDCRCILLQQLAREQDSSPLDVFPDNWMEIVSPATHIIYVSQISIFIFAYSIVHPSCATQLSTVDMVT